MFERQSRQEAIDEGVKEYIDDGNFVSFRDDKESEQARNDERIMRLRKQRERLHKNERKKGVRAMEYRIEQSRKSAFVKSDIVEHSENREYFDIFKKIVKDRLIGHGEIRKELLDAVQDNPMISEEKLREIAFSVAAHNQIPIESIADTVDALIDAYRVRRAAVEKFRVDGDFPGRKYLEECHAGDFEKDYRDGHLEIVKKPFNVELNYTKDAYPKSSSGVYLPGINEGSITMIEGGMGDTGQIDVDTDIDKTRRHEDGHAIYALSEDRQKNIEHDHMERVSDALRQYKDELFAFLRADGNMHAFISICFLNSDFAINRTLDREPFCKVTRDDKLLAIQKGAGYNKFLKDLSLQEVDRVVSIIERAARAIQKVRDRRSNFSVEEIIGIFQHQPMKQWSAVARRVLGE